MKKLFLLTFIIFNCLVAPAQAANELSATITSVSSQWISQSADLAININFTTSSFHDEISVATNISTTPIIGRSQIPALLRNRNLPSLKALAVDNAINVDAGSHDFQVLLSRSQLKFRTSGAYLLHFTLKAGELETPINLVMPVITSTRFNNPLNIAVLWPVSTSPMLRADYSLLPDADGFGEGSTLDAMVKAGTNGVTWLKDADAIQTALASGADGWVESLNAKTENADAFSLPFANAEISSLLRAKLKTAAVRATNTSNNLLYIPKSGDLSLSTWNYISSLGGVVVLSDKCYPSNTSIYTPSGIYKSSQGQAKALVIDSQMSSFLTRAISDDAGSTIYQQALLSDALVTQLERPNANRVIVITPNINRVRVATSNAEKTLNGLANPWLRSIKVGAALNLNAGTRTHAQCNNVTLPKSSITQLLASEKARLRMQSLIAGTDEEKKLIEAMLRVSSMNSSKASQVDLRQDLNDYTSFIYNSVRILSSGAVVFPQEQGKVPITIQNALSVPVKVLINATGEPSVRVIPEPLELIEIPAGKRKSIEISTRLVGSDLGFLKLQLTDESGKSIGTAKRIQLSSAAYASIARWVLIGAACALLILIVRNFYRRFRRSSGKNANL